MGGGKKKGKKGGGGDQVGLALRKAANRGKTGQRQAQTLKEQHALVSD